MANPLTDQVTRPTSFDGTKDYALVLGRGDTPLGDYDLNDAQRILRHDLAAVFGALFVEGAILLESGGSIATPVAGVNLGSDALGSAGTYVGVESQLYTVTITMGGAAGTARYQWRSTGSDGPAFPTEDRTIQAIAPDLATAQAAPSTYGHAVGALGIVVYFLNPNGFMTGANSWVVAATYGARTPVVAGTVITVSDLLVPVAGRLHRVPGAALTYPSASSGIAIVYGEWTRSIVTHADDATLRDPLSQTPQAWRERWRMVLRTTDTSGDTLGVNDLERRVFPLYRWDRATDVVERIVRRPYAIDLDRTQGAIDAERLLNVDQNELLRGRLARLDHGAHGSYVVAPLPPAPRAVVSTNAASPGKIRLAVPPVTASVDGVEVVRAAPEEIELDEASDFAVVNAESHTFTTGTDLYLLNKAAGTTTFPVKQITELTATVQVGVLDSAGTYEAVIRGTGDDLLAHTPVEAIIRVSNTNGGAADYTQGTHYSLTGNSVHWITGAPGNGVTYYVVYRYTKTMIEGADFTLTTGGQVDFSPAGDNPVNGTAFSVDYQYYLARHDAVILRPTGDLGVVRGQPAEVPVSPGVPWDTLAYCRVEIAANSASVAIRRYENDRVTHEELNALKARVDQLLRDLAGQDLVNQARSRTTANFLDILAEDFTTLLLADLTYNAGGVVFASTLDTEVGTEGTPPWGECTLPFTETLATLTKAAIPSGETDVRVGGAFFTLPYTPEVAIDSSAWSEPWPVNPYEDFTPEPPAVAISPSQDQWVDTTLTSSTHTRVVQNGRHEDYRIVRRTTEVRTRTSEIAALFMRQITVAVSGAHFVPGEKVRLRFGGKDVTFTADAPSTQGADSYTVLARASDASHTYGTVTGHSTIPANVPTGTVAVELWGDSGMVGSTWPTNYARRASALFTSLGTQRQLAVEVTKILVQNDPVAQSVSFGAARMLARIEVPLASKAPNLAPPLLFEVRATDRSGRASTPTEDVLARVVREAAALSAGDSSSNVIDFADPVLVPPGEFRTLVLRSADNRYAVYVAKLGHGNPVAGGFIQQQQIPGGIFMDSSNNFDWTLHQDWDLRCKVSVAHMSALEARCYFGRVTVTDITGLYLSVDQVVPDGTSIEWQYSVDGLANGTGGKVWTTCAPFALVELSAVAAQVDLRAILRTTDAYVTPAIATGSVSLLVQSNQTAGKYVSRAKSVAPATTAVHGGYEEWQPSGTTNDVLVSIDGGATWSTVTPTALGTTPDGWSAYTYSKTGLTPQAAPLLRLRVDQTTSNKAVRPRVRRLYGYAA